MLRDEFLKELHGLSRADKLRIMQLLVDDLSQEELLKPGAEDTPDGSEEAAQILWKVLQAARGK